MAVTLRYFTEFAGIWTKYATVDEVRPTLSAEKCSPNNLLFAMHDL